MTTCKKYLVHLRAHGNPDFYESDSIGVSPITVPVNSLEEASKAALDFIRHWDLGGGNFPHARVTNCKGKLVAEVSYNGRVWPPNHDDNLTRDMKPLVEPKVMRYNKDGSVRKVRKSRSKPSRKR